MNPAAPVTRIVFPFRLILSILFSVFIFLDCPCRGLITLPPEQIGMGSGLEKQQRELIIVLLPRHQPVRLYVALPLTLMVALQLVRPILSRQSAIFRQQVHRIVHKLHIKATLSTPFKISLKAG
jgi:hypothetical protein